ncbi:hypothetical protein NHQ30_006229 [Ciborinia camelliae]|nr:hypothetical protein NHQ30_006229 [Ciborinia camelliae]
MRLSAVLTPIQTPINHPPKSPTAEHPALDLRRLRLIEAFKKYSFRGLYEQLHLLAREDLAISKVHMQPNHIEPVIRRRINAVE